MTLNTASVEDLVVIAVCVIAACLLWMAARRLRRWVSTWDLTGAELRTIAAIAVPTAVSIQGMYGVTRDALGWPVYLAVALCAFIEIVMYDRAMAARKAMMDDPEHSRPGVDAAAVWVLTSASALMSTLHAATFLEGVFRAIAPFIAAFSWHRYLKAEQRSKRTGTALKGINWRLSPERVLIKLGLADPTDRTAGQVSAERTLMTLAIAARAADTAQQGWRKKRAGRRLDAALQRALEYARLGTDPAAELQLVNSLAVLNGAQSLMELRPAPPWSTTTATGTDIEGVYRDLIGRGVVEVDARTRGVLGLSAVSTPPALTRWSPGIIDPAEAPATGQPDGQPDGTADAGQPRIVDLRTAIIAASKNNMSYREIAKRFGVSKSWVGEVVGAAKAGQTATLNGHRPDGDDQP